MICSGLSCQKSLVTPKTSKKTPSRIYCQTGSTETKQNIIQYNVNLERRSALLLGSVFAIGFVQLNQKAFALIPDDDDEELIELAKSRRAARLQEQKEVQREFITSEGLQDRSVSEEVAQVQKAVIKLAKSGDALESGDVKAVNDLLQSSQWLDEFKSASQKLSLTSSQKSKAQGAIEELNGLVSSSGSSDLVALKKSYVSAVDALEGWCQDAGLAASIKGL